MSQRKYDKILIVKEISNAVC